MSTNAPDRIKIKQPVSSSFGPVELTILNAIMLSRRSLIFEHVHPFFELHLVKSGASIIHIDGECYPVSPGDFCWINPNTCRFVEVSPQGPHEHLVIHFEFTNRAVNDAANLLDYDEMSHFLSMIYKRKAWISRDIQLCENAVRLIEEQMAQTKFGYMILVRNTLCSLIVQAIQNIGLQGMQVNPAEPWLPVDPADEVLSYIRAHYTESITIEKTAKALNISERHLTRVLRERYGTTFNRALLSHRIAYVQEALTNSDHDLEQIAEESGFSSAAIMCSNFKKITGWTVGRYRKAARQDLF